MCIYTYRYVGIYSYIYVCLYSFSYMYVCIFVYIWLYIGGFVFGDSWFIMVFFVLVVFSFRTVFGLQLRCLYRLGFFSQWCLWVLQIISLVSQRFCFRITVFRRSVQRSRAIRRSRRRSWRRILFFRYLILVGGVILVSLWFFYLVRFVFGRVRFYSDRCCLYVSQSLVLCLELRLRVTGQIWFWVFLGRGGFRLVGVRR